MQHNIRRSTRAALLLVSRGGGVSTGPHGIITLGIGLPENNMIWFFTTGLNVGVSAPAPAPEMLIVEPDSVFAPREEPIAVEPDSVFAEREPVVEEYTGRVLWGWYSEPTPTTSILEKIVLLVKKVFR